MDTQILLCGRGGGGALWGGGGGGEVHFAGVELTAGRLQELDPSTQNLSWETAAVEENLHR